MKNDFQHKMGPLVSIILPTFNRPRYFADALRSAVQQNYDNLQIIVVNDGGQDVSSIVSSFNDPRIAFIDRKENKGKAFSLNQAIEYVKGKYISYLDDDDLYYSDHISKLVDVLETGTDCQVAYSDLYKTYCRIMPDASRLPLSKIVEISRDFDSYFMLYFNHVLHVSLMHRTDLFNKTGLYNESLNILIDWDMTRRLVFFSDFYHLLDITGEFYSPIGDSDRISVVQRKNKDNYLKNLMKIRTTRPPQPWSKLKDLSIIFTYDCLNQQAGNTIGLIWRHVFYPYQVFLPLAPGEFDKLRTEMPNIVPVPIEPYASKKSQINSATLKCGGEYVAVIPGGFPITEMTIENSLYVLIKNPQQSQCLELEGSTENLWGCVVAKRDLLNARMRFPDLALKESLIASGIVPRKPTVEELPFQFDILLKQGQTAEEDGSWLGAADVFEHIAANHKNDIWMKTLAAKSFFKAGVYDMASRLSSDVNRLRPTIETLLLEAKVHGKRNNFTAAIPLLKQAEQILTGKEWIWT